MNPRAIFSLACKLIGVTTGVQTLLIIPGVLLMGMLGSPVSVSPGKLGYHLTGTILVLFIAWVLVRYADAFARWFVDQSGDIARDLCSFDDRRVFVLAVKICLPRCCTRSFRAF